MKKLILVIILIISLVIINNLVRSIINLWQKQELVGMTEEQLQKEKALHEKLKKQYTVVKKSDFVEKEARNKLFLVQPGEEVVILPKENQTVTKEADIVVKRKVKQSPPEEWLRLFAIHRED